MAIYIWALGSVIMLALGSMHLYLTFFTRKFSSANHHMIQEMKLSSPLLTKQTTMWKAWVGFNASHSIGVLFIGSINLFLIWKYYSVLSSDYYYFIFNIFISGVYVWLARKYWFRIPFIGTCFTFVCYVISFLLILIY